MIFLRPCAPVSAKMADSPPPLDDVEINQESEDEAPSTVTSKEPDPPLSEEPPLFAETEEPEDPGIPVDFEEEKEEPEVPSITVPPPTLEATAAEEVSEPAEEIGGSTLVESAATKPLDLFKDYEKETETGKEVCDIAMWCNTSMSIIVI